MSGHTFRFCLTVSNLLIFSQIQLFLLVRGMTAKLPRYSKILVIRTSFVFRNIYFPAFTVSPGTFFKQIFKGWRRKRALPRESIPEPANGQFIPLKKFRHQFPRGQRNKRDLERALNHEFMLHVRRRRFISKVICEGIVGGGCQGKLHVEERLCV